LGAWGALANKDLGVLADAFEDNVTPVLVTREVIWDETSGNNALRAELESHLAEWAASKAEGDFFSFLSLYDDDFKRWGMDKTEWSFLQLQSARKRAAYPDEDDLYLSRFRQTVRDTEREITSTTRLYWRRNASGFLKIIAEDEG